MTPDNDMATTPAVDNSIRVQRDRFLAFSFAAADVLIEVDAEGIITYCVGRSQALFGHTEQNMLNKRARSLVDPVDARMVDEVLKRIVVSGRSDGVILRVPKPEGNDVVVRLSGLRMPGAGGAHLAVSRARGNEIADLGKVDRDGFTKIAAQRAKESGESGEDYHMTLVSMNEDSLKGRMEAADADAMVDGLRSQMRAWSVGGNSAGQLADGTYGVIHDANVSSEDIKNRIAESSVELDPTGQGLNVSAGSVGLEAGNLSDADMEKALTYAISKFIADPDKPVSMASLSAGYEDMMVQALAQVTSFRDMIANNRFHFFYQPIVHLEEWKVHHYEALGRVLAEGKYVAPFEAVTFAEEFGIVPELDINVCEKAVKILNEGVKGNKDAHIAVNVSGLSMSKKGFIEKLVRLLTKNRQVCNQLLIEVTESAEITDLELCNQGLQQFRKLNCKVCIDDFGAGAATFQYLRALDVDYVKIDGVYVRDAASGKRHGEPFIRAIGSMCRDLGIHTIAEYVEDEKTVELLRNSFIDYGQGYYFGKPMKETMMTNLPTKPTYDVSRKRKGASSSWG